MKIIEDVLDHDDEAAAKSWMEQQRALPEFIGGRILRSRKSPVRTILYYHPSKTQRGQEKEFPLPFVRALRD